MKILAIDQGTTSTRGLLASSAGGLTAVFQHAHRQILPGPAMVEHDPEELLADVAAAARAGAGAGAQAVALGNQGESCLGWDARRGRAVSPVLVWQDARTAPALTALGKEAEAVSLARAGLPLDPYFSASKLGWIAAQPQARRLAEDGRLRLGTTDAFFRDRLTGRFETDVATASRTGLMNIKTGAWDPILCEMHGVPLECLPAIGACSGDLGVIEGLPLAASIVDQQAALYGHGCRRAGDAKITFGTGAFALALTGGTLIRPEKGPLPTIAWRLAGEETCYALDGGVYAASAAVNWARGLGLFSDFDEISAYDRPSPLSRGIAFVPALAGLACPHWDRMSKGSFLGLTLASDRRDLAAAVLEGVALRMAEALRAIARNQALTAVIPVDGGMSANRWFVQQTANAAGRALRVSTEPELTALGLAQMAGAALGGEIPSPPPGPLVEPEPGAPDLRADFARAVALTRMWT